MKTTHFIALLLILFIAFSCKKSSSHSDMEEYDCVVEESELSLRIDNAKTLVPERYYEDVDLLFFNENGDSLIMQKSFMIDTTFVSTEEFTCQGVVQVLNIVEPKKRVIFLSKHPEINIRLDIIVEAYASLTNWEYKPREILNYYPSRTNDLVPYGATNIITYEDGQIIANLADYVSEIDLNGRIFRNVFISKILKNNIEYNLYYTENQGVIGFDMPGGEGWYFNSFIE